MRCRMAQNGAAPHVALFSPHRAAFVSTRLQDAYNAACTARRGTVGPQSNALHPVWTDLRCDELACLCVKSVCVFFREHISGTRRPIFTALLCLLAQPDRGLLVLLWWRCDTLCTSGFMDYVIFTHNGPRGGISTLLQPATSMRRRAQANARAASCWLRRVLTTGAETSRVHRARGVRGAMHHWHWQFLSCSIAG